MEDLAEDDDPDTAPSGAVSAAPYVEFTATEALAGERLDKALAVLANGQPGLSRSRIAEALAAGRVTGADGAALPARGIRAAPGETYRIALPPPAPARPEPEAIPLSVLHEDAHLVVVDKPAGMVVHPAPGAEHGTLVNALLHHCGESLAGIGGERRPGIVHRIDKDTSGLLVVAKTEAAHAGLSALFAAHDIERAYTAILWGVPDPGDARLMGLPAVSRHADGALTIDAPIARHPADRKRMAVRAGGRHAITHLAAEERFGPAASPWACRATAWLETGRTHQIRVHAAHIGHPLLGDPVYGQGRRRLPNAAPAALAGAAQSFPRQALHAARLGFRHPITGVMLDFATPPPADLNEMLKLLRRNTDIGR